MIDYFEIPKTQYFSHGVNTKEFYPKEPTFNQNPFSIGPSYPHDIDEWGYFYFAPKLLMVANNGLANDPTFDRKGFQYGLGLAMMNNLEITIAGPSHNKQFFNENLWMLSYPKLNLEFDIPNDKLLDLYHQHDVFEMNKGLKHIHENWDWYREKVKETTDKLSWENRTKELISIYERYIN